MGWDAFAKLVKKDPVSSAGTGISLAGMLGGAASLASSGSGGEFDVGGAAAWGALSGAGIGLSSSKDHKRMALISLASALGLGGWNAGIAELGNRALK